MPYLNIIGLIGLSGLVTPPRGESKPGEALEPAAPRSLFKRSMFFIFAVLAFAAFVTLGTWQIYRRSWKLDLIAEVEQRIHAEPVPAPGPSAWARLSPKDDAYRRVAATGTFLYNRATLVLAVTARGGGFWVLTPLRTREGFLVLVNRGFVPAESRAPADRAAGELAGPSRVTGLLRLTEPGGGFLRRNDPAADRWYSRDVAAIACARGLGDVAPYFIDADGTPNPGGLPIGGLTVVQFSNHHLIYALTWYALALLLAGGILHNLAATRAAGGLARPLQTSPTATMKT